MQKRSEIAAKVRKLLARTISSGCTESEALAAARTASRLMAEHDLTYLDVELGPTIEDDRYGARARPIPVTHDVHRCVGSIADLFDVMGWRRGAELVYFGEAEDTWRAHAMTSAIATAIETEWLRFARSAWMRTAADRLSFVSGMADRINERLATMRAERGRASAAGKSLVVLRAEIVTERYRSYAKQNGLSMSMAAPMAASSERVDAYAAGRAAGARADLGGLKIGERVAGLLTA